MPNISVISKESHQVLENVNSSKVGLNENSVVVVQVSKDDVASITRENNNALITLRNGEVIVVENYFNAEFADNSLVFQDDSGQLYWVKFTNTDGTIAETILYYPIEEIEPLLYFDNFVGGILPWLVGAGVAGIAAAAGGGGGGDGGSTPPPAPIVNALPAPTITDDVAPQTGVVANGGATNDTLPAISGEGAQPGATIKVYDGEQLIGETVANEDGTWEFVPTTPLAEGPHNLTVTQTVNGQESAKSPISDFNVDTKAPDVSIDPINVSNDPTPEIKGKTEVGATVDVVIKDKDGKVVAQGPATVDSDGNWTFTPTTALPEGDYTVEATAKDAAGNTTSATPDDFVVDTTPPDISIDKPVVTNDTTPAITGKAEAGSTVDVVVKDKNGTTVAQGPATVNPDGTWSFTPSTELPEGEYTVDATAKDPNGNTDTATPEKLVIDTTPPEVSINPPVDTNDTTPELTGKTEPGSTVDVVIKDKDDKVVAEGPATVDPEGNWTFTPTTPLPEGELTVEATAKDPAGNGKDAAPEELVVDTTPPEITIDKPVVTNNTKPEVTGQVEPGSTVDVVIKDAANNPVASGPATVNPDGTWTFTPTTPLPEGELTVNATATDPTGNPTDAAPEELVIDTTPPEITIDPPITTNDLTPEIKGETEPGSTVDVVIRDKDGKPVAEGTATVNPDGSWSYTPTVDLPEGKYTVDATAKDPAGNEKKEEGIGGLEIDTTPPGIDIDPPTNGEDGDDDWWNDTPASASTAQFSAFSLQSVAATEQLLKTETSVAFHIKNPEYVFSGNTKNDVVRVELEILDKDGKVVSKGPATTYDQSTDKWTYNTGVKLVDGQYTLIARGYDQAGNSNTDSIQVIVDTVAPPVEVVDFGLTNDSTPTFTGTTEAGIETVRVTVKDETGKTVQSATVKPNADGTWSFTPNNLVDGKYTVEAIARDLAGNITPVPDVAGVIVDTTPPPISIDESKPTNDTTPEIKGKTEPEATVNVVIKDATGASVAQGPATVNPDGTWTFTPTTALPEGKYTVEATATDKATNQATANAPTELVVDTTAPIGVSVDAIDLTNDATPTLTGKTEVGSSVVVTVTDVNGKVVTGPATVNADGTWTFTPSEDLADGPQKVVAVATDAAGNTAQATEEFVVDTVPPAIAIDELKPTNDITPDVTGTTEPGATVDVVIKDAANNPVASGPATVNPDGTWTFTPTTELPEGKYTVEATAKDPAGNEASAELGGLDVILTGVEVAIDPIDLTNDATPEITGTTTNGKTVVVTVTDVNGKVVTGPATVNADGTWTYTPSENLAEGPQKVVAKATDVAGNTKEATEEFVVDTVPPVVSIDPINPTNDTTPEVTGKTEPGATVDVVIKDKDGKTVAEGPATVNPDGTWSFTPTTELPEGKYTVEATAKDPAGNEASVDAPVELEVDTTLPQVAIDAIDLTNDATPEIKGTTEPGAKVIVTITDANGKVVTGPAIVNADGTWTYTPSENLAEGPQKVVAEATDAAGNTAKANEDFVVDTVPPVVTIDELKPTNDTTPEVTGTTEPGATVDVVIKDAANNPVASGPATVNPDGTWTFTPTTELPEGKYTVEATAKDPAGNEASVDAEAGLNVDLTGPQVTIDPIDVTNDATPEIKGTTESGATVDVVVKDLNGQPVAQGSATVDANGNWTFTPTTDLPEGEYTVEATAKDAAGNTGSAKEDFTVDVDGPAVTIDPIDSTNDTTPEVTGTTEPGATVDVVIKDKDGKTVAEGPATVDPEGNWTFTPTTELPEGNYTVEAVGKDPIGNTGDTAKEDFAVDTTAPIGVSIDAVNDTNDNTPTITGKTEPGTTVVVSLTDENGKVVSGPATVNPDGTWTFTSPVLTDGKQNVVAVATDKAGNTAQATEDFIVDTIGPDIDVYPVSLTDEINDKTPEFTGKTEAGAKVDLVITHLLTGSVLTATVYADANGDFKYVPFFEAPEGDYTVTGVATDKLGNKGAPDSEEFRVDVTPPTNVSINPIDTTNDTTPEITGTTEIGSTVEVTVTDSAGKVVKGSATVNPDGTWSYTPSEELAEGKQTAVAVASDKAGNTAKATEEFEIDVDGPSISIDPIDETNDTTPTISGKTEPGATVNVVVKDNDGKTVAEGPATVDADGNWTFTPTTPLPEGNYAVEAIAKDKLDNPSDPAVEAFEVDTTAPVVTIDPIVLTNDTTPTVTGKAEPDSTVDVVITDKDGKTVAEGPATVNPDGTWSFTPTTPLPEGEYTVDATAKDPAGNASDATPEKLVIDTTPPVVSIDPIDETNDKTPEITGKTEPGSTVDVVIKDKDDKTVAEGTATVNPDGTWTYTPTEELSEGDYTVEATAKDPAGNTGDAKPEDFKLDTTPPTNVTIDEIDLTNDATPEITGTTEPGTLVKVTITDTAGKSVTGAATVDSNGNWTYTPTENLSEGRQDVVAVATDKAGNTAQDTEDFIVDLSGPTITIDPIDETNDTTPTISGKTDEGSTVNVEIKDKDGKVVAQGSATVDSEGNWSFTPSTPLPEGNYAVEAIAKDGQGNPSDPAVEAFEVDTTAPVVTIDPLVPTNDTTPTVSGKTEPDAKVEVAIKDKDGKTVAEGPATVNPDGTWTFTPSTPLPEGNFTVEATAKDPAGNETDATPEALVIDTTPPIITIDPPVETNDTTPELTGKVEAGSTVDVVVKDKDGKTVAEGPATVKPDGTWTYTPTTPLPEGEFTVEATAKDPAGNEIDSAPEGLVIDTTAPSITIDQPRETNDTTPEIKGNTEVGALVDVVIKDSTGKTVAQGPATVNLDGTWSFTPSTPLAEGNFTVDATAKDAAGNETDATPKGLVIDTTPPTITIDPPVETNDTTPELTGEAEPGSTVDVVIKDKNGETVSEGTATVTPEGEWTYTPTTPLPEGEYTVDATATDPAGNEKPTGPVDLVVDTTAPQITIDPIGDSTTNATNNQQHPITGTGEAGTTVTLSIVGSKGYVLEGIKVTVGDDGKWSYVPTEKLPEEIFTITGVPSDAAGNVGQTKTQKFEVDITPPVITIDPPETGGGDDDWWNDVSTFASPASFAAPVAAFAAPIATTFAAPMMARMAFSAPVVEEAVVAQVEPVFLTSAITSTINQLGSAVTSAPHYYFKDKQPTFNGVLMDGAISVDVVIVRDADGNLIESGPATLLGGDRWTYTLQNPLADGVYQIEAVGRDLAGNPSAPAVLVFEVDTVLPTVEIFDSEPTNDVTPTITGTTSEPAGTVDVAIIKNGVLVDRGSATVDPVTGNWSFTTNVDLTEGTYVVQALAKDKAGNSSIDTNNLTVDITPPDAPLGEFNADGSVLEGTAQAGSLVTYNGPNGEVLTTKADDVTGAFKFELSPAVDKGQNVTLTATDVAGTSGPTTVTAPYVTNNDAVDDVAQAFIDYDHPVTERVIDNAICYSWKFGEFGYVIGRDSGSTTFEIGKGKHADIELQIKTGSLKAIFDQVKLVLSKYNPTNGVWEKVASNSDSGLFDFLGFFGEKATVKVNDLEAGKYRIDMESWSAITKFGYVETDVVIREVSSDFKVEVSDVHNAEGNILLNDTLDGSTKLTEVDGVAVNDAGVTINGDHGTLIIKADGSYTYKPNADLKNIGQTDVFEYTLTDVNGKTTTADLIVQIGTNSGIDLTWDPTDPAKPATTNLSVSDDVNSAQTTVKKAADTVQSLVCGSACSAAYYSGKKVDGVSKLAIQSLAEGSTAKIAIKSTLACSQTITGDKFSYQVQYKDSAGNWVNASGTGASGSVIGNGYKYAGTALFNTSYQADSALSKQWQVVFTTSEANYSHRGSNSTMINTYVQATVSSDKLVTEGVNKAVGNVITDDTGFGADKLASKDDQLFVKNPNTGNFELATGDVISVAAGKLVLNQDGSYVFTPAANATAADVEFEYKLVAPNGVEKSATLTIDLGKAFVSSAANDTVALGEGADKIIFNVLNASDKTGGNGHDTWTDFKAENNDKIDISKLLQGDVNSENIDQYVSVNKVGNDTVISIDRDGSGTNYAKADLITLKNTDTTLQDLLNNNNVLY